MDKHSQFIASNPHLVFDLKPSTMRQWAAHIGACITREHRFVHVNSCDQHLRQAMGARFLTRPLLLVLDEKRFSNLAKRLAEVLAGSERIEIPHKQARLMLGQAMGWESEHHIAAALRDTDTGLPTDAWLVPVAEQTTEEALSFEDNPRAYFDFLASLGMADVVHNPLKGDVFIDITIEGQRFRAHVGEGKPYMELTNGRYEMGSVHYGVSSIQKALQSSHDAKYRWAVCKYVGEFRIDLSKLTNAGMRRLAVELGLAIRLPSEREGEMPHQRVSLLPEPDACFVQSKAFDAAVAWARQHPRKVAAMAKFSNSYTGDWAAKVQAAARATDKEAIPG